MVKNYLLLFKSPSYLDMFWKKSPQLQRQEVDNQGGVICLLDGRSICHALVCLCKLNGLGTLHLLSGPDISVVQIRWKEGVK